MSNTHNCYIKLKTLEGYAPGKQKIWLALIQDRDKEPVECCPKTPKELQSVNLCLCCLCCFCHVSYANPPAYLFHCSWSEKEGSRSFHMEEKQRGEAKGGKHLKAESGIGKSAAVIT